MATLSFDQFKNFFKYYKELPHQDDGLWKLYSQMRFGLKDENHVWVKAYRNASEEPPGGVLNVPYQSQRDNASGSGYRECFSSSCAMVAMYYGVIDGDDAYNLVRERYGDSTDAMAQVHALRSLGLEAQFISNASSATIRSALAQGRPVPVGWLHHGTHTAPTGGHWSVIIGETPETWVHHDPYGTADLVSGLYIDQGGERRLYAKTLWNPRWEVEGEGSGWMLDIRKPA